MDGLDKLEIIDEHKPEYCPTCGGPLDYVGLGEYKCSACKQITYDDYGKVRVYLEKHPGANIVQLTNATGVSKATIRKMLDDNRFSVSGDRHI